MPLPGMSPQQVPDGKTAAVAAPAATTGVSSMAAVPPPPPQAAVPGADAPAAVQTPPPPVAQPSAAPAAPPAPPQAAQEPAATPAPPAPPPVAEAAPAPAPAPAQEPSAVAPAPPVPSAAVPVPSNAPPAPDTDKALVERSGHSSVPEAASLNKLAEEDGFEGLSFDSYGVFPLIKLDSGSFQTSEGEDLGTEFNCVMLRSRPKYLYRTDLPRDDDRNEIVYSYDNTTSTRGEPLNDVFDQWRQKGLNPVPTPTRYVEVTARLVPTGQLVLLSVAQQSVGNLSAYWAQMRFKGVDLKTSVTRVFRGKKVERAKTPFYPWAFAHNPDAVDPAAA